MKVPQTLQQSGLKLLNKNEDDILEQLGKEIYLIEQKRTGQRLGRLKVADYKKRGQKLWEDNIDTLKWAICPEWKDKTKDDFLENSILFTAFVVVVAETMHWPPSQLALATTFSAYIIRRGLNRLCVQG